MFAENRTLPLPVMHALTYITHQISLMINQDWWIIVLLTFFLSQVADEGKFLIPQEDTVTFSQGFISNYLVFQSARTWRWQFFVAISLILPDWYLRMGPAIRGTDRGCWRERRGQQSCPNGLTAGD